MVSPPHSPNTGDSSGGKSPGGGEDSVASSLDKDQVDAGGEGSVALLLGLPSWPNFSRRSGPELWSLPSLPPFSSGDSLPPPESTAYVTVEQKKYLKSIEHMRGVLSNLELEVEKRCEEIVNLYIANLSMYLILITGGSLMGYYFSGSSATAFGFIGLVLLSLVLGIALAIYFNWKKLDNFTWRMSKIEEWRNRMRSDINIFSSKLDVYVGVVDHSSNLKLTEARTLSKEILSSIGSGSFKDDHKKQFIGISVWAVIYVCLVILWIVLKQQKPPGVSVTDTIKSLIGGAIFGGLL